MVNNKQKGNTVENEATKILEEVTSFEWNRVPGSGAFQTVGRLKGKHFTGDVFTEGTKKFDTLSVEVKGTTKLSLTDTHSKKGKVSKYIEQCEGQSSNWILLIKVNYKGWYLVQPMVNPTSDLVSDKYELDFKYDEGFNSIWINDEYLMRKLK